MPTSFTYATLKSAIQSFAGGDTGTKLDAAIDATILPLAETRTLKDLNIEIFDAVASVSFASGTATVTKPSGHISTRSLIYIAGTTRSTLLERSYEYLLDYAPDSSLTGTPLYYCELNDTQWQVAPIPVSSVTGSSR